MSCSIERCCEQGVFTPVLALSGNGDHGEVALKSLRLCAEHKEQITPEILLVDETWNEICRVYRANKKPIPVRRWTTVRWEIVRPEDEESDARN